MDSDHEQQVSLYSNGHTFDNLMKRLQRAQSGIQEIEKEYIKFMEEVDELYVNGKQKLDADSTLYFLKLISSKLSLFLPSTSEPGMSTSSSEKLNSNAPNCGEPKTRANVSLNLNTKNNQQEQKYSVVDESQPSTSSSHNSLKRKRINDDNLDCEEFANGSNFQKARIIKSLNEFLPNKSMGEIEYPKKIEDKVILGPNGTEIAIETYRAAKWSSVAAATRHLLGLVFPINILATHTLSGKPSPAFYGREKATKNRLDANKTADIIHCVRSIINCTEREVRAAITAKCGETARKYKSHIYVDWKSENAK